MHCFISSRGVFGMNHFNLRNFAVIATYFFPTVDRGSTMTRIPRWSMMIYGSLQDEFMETKHNSYIRRYGTHIFGSIFVPADKVGRAHRNGERSSVRASVRLSSSKKSMKLDENGRSVGLYTYWVSVQNWFAFGPCWPNFDPLMAPKWLKKVVSDHHLK